MYNENLSYDKNGNIMNLSRYGDRDEQYLPIQIDNLGYTYATNSNKLLNVADASNNTSGFNDFNKTGDDYVYDANGNMTVDKNKNISGIVYNHLNLPTKIIFPTGNIVYFYNASGQKVQKVVTETTTITTTDYLGGYQYKNLVLQFFPTAEGYVKNTPVSGTNTYSYVFNYTDHLGNVRLSYTKNPSTNALDIIEENNYYPFGLKHNGYNVDNFQPEYKYKYQGQERQDELGLNWDSFKYRNYDYAIGRFISIDPLAEDYPYNSTYAFQENKMGMGTELEGKELQVHIWLTIDAAINPNGVGAHTKGVVQGLANSAIGLWNAVTHPVETAKEIGNSALWLAVGSQASGSVDSLLGTNSSGAGDSILASVYNGANTLANGNGEARGTVMGEIAGTIVAGEVIGAGLGKLGPTAKGVTADTKLIGPAGDASASVTKQIPNGWNMKTSRNGQGTTFTDPLNPKGNNVRVQGGNPNSPNTAQQSPYVRQTANGKTVDVNGKPSTNASQTHIPKEEFKYKK
jgi:RHS repeat-associated protein